MNTKKLSRLLRHPNAPALAILAVWLVGFFVLLYKTVPVAGDGIYYFAYLRSLFIDHDLNFRNELAHFAGQNIFVAGQLASGVLTPTGLTHNLYAVGPAFLWAPFYAVARLLALAQGFANGYSRLELLAPSIGTALYGLLGLGLSYASLKKIFAVYATASGERSRVRGIFAMANSKKALLAGDQSRAKRIAWFSAAAIVMILLGTNLFYYLFIEASLAHGLGFFVVSLLFYLWLLWAGSLSLAARFGLVWWRLLVLGLVAGLAGLTRWQLIVVGPILVGIDLIWELFLARTKKSTLRILSLLGRLALFIAGLILAFVPQLWVWSVLYGHALVIPQGRGFIQLNSPHFWQVLFSSRHGLLTWSPLTVLALVGLGLAWWRRRRERWPWALVLIFLVQTYINGAALEWWGGDAFGPRRFTDISFIFMAGLMVVLITVLRKFFWRGRALILVALIIVLVGGNLIFMQLFRHDLLPRDKAVTWPQIFDALKNYH